MLTKLSICTILIQYVILYPTPIVSVAIDYCGSEVCNNSKQHTLCKFESSEPGLRCLEYERTVKSEDLKEALLDKLNSRRDKIAAGEVRSFPPAENMLKLEWNEDLEKSAQRWADQCVESSVPDNKDQCRDLGSIPVGQNIASVYGESPGLSPLSLVDVWYIELLNTNSTVLRRYRPSSESGTSHHEYFTQLVWARSSEVGCGGVQFKEKTKDSSYLKNRTVHRLVCNFATSGNVLSETVYSEGPPCSRCPNGGVCDSIYNHLCTLENNNKLRTETKNIKSEIATVETPTLMLSDKKIFNNIEKNSNKSHVDEALDTEADNMTVFDYFSEIYGYTRESLTKGTTSSANLCEGNLAVDEFVELLKKKLSTDPLFKDLLSTKQPFQNGNADSSFTDPSVAALVSRIYSKKEPSTTTKLPDQDYVNSTLLVDLVEAVIFRSGDKPYATEESKETQQSQEVNPVKIQAELAEVKINQEFTGHYFFPEDTNEETVSETTDVYYDTSNLPVSDVILEIENLKRDKITHDFLDEIMDFGPEIDESTTKVEALSLGKIRERRSKNSELEDVNIDARLLLRGQLPISSYEYNNNIKVKYDNVLRKLASDLKLLKLNNQFHCSSCVNCAKNIKICKKMYLTLVILFPILTNHVNMLVK